MRLVQDQRDGDARERLVVGMRRDGHCGIQALLALRTTDHSVCFGTGRRSGGAARSGDDRQPSLLADDVESVAVRQRR
jgi:hypothetical protein